MAAVAAAGPASVGAGGSCWPGAGRLLLLAADAGCWLLVANAGRLLASCCYCCCCCGWLQLLALVALQLESEDCLLDCGPLGWLLRWMAPLGANAASLS